MELEAEEHDMLHSILSKLPKPLDLDALISRTSELFEQHPPNRLQGLSWFYISNNSVLKTTRDPQKLAKQTLHDGEVFFQRQATEISRHKSRMKAFQKARLLARKHRRPAVAAGTAVLVALLALYLRRETASLATVLDRIYPTLFAIGDRFRSALGVFAR